MKINMNRGVLVKVKVVKFGGSSLADAEHFKKVKEIITADSSRRYVIPSAPGKRFDDDIKVTDMLYECYDLASNGGGFEKHFAKIACRYEQIIDDLGIELNLDDEFDIIRKGFISGAGRDFAASRGEYLNGIVLAEFLGYEFVDAARVIFFDEKGEFDSERTNQALANELSNIERAVIPGFYGAMPNDTIKTFSRGGSDVTGSIVSRAVKASMYENWTDVSGFLVADPRIIDNPKVITCITYRELRELSYMGAGVLHEDAIFPVRTAGIPINIKNTNDVNAPGTMIVAEADDKPSKYIITGIAGKKGFTIINIEKDMMNAELGFGRRALSVLEENNISFEHLPSGIDTMCVIVGNDDIDGKEEKIRQEIIRETGAEYVRIEKGLALLAIVGRGMRSTRGTAARIFAALAHSNINVRMIDQGSSELNIIVGVDEDDFERAIKAIYDIFILCL